MPTPLSTRSLKRQCSASDALAPPTNIKHAMAALRVQSLGMEFARCGADIQKVTIFCSSSPVNAVPVVGRCTATRQCLRMVWKTGRQ